MRSTKQKRMWVRSQLMYTLEQTIKDKVYLRRYHEPTDSMYNVLYMACTSVDYALITSAYAPGNDTASNFSPTNINKVIDAFY